MTRVIVATLLALGLVGCVTAGDAVVNPGDTAYTWSYVEGPNGENCLVAQRWVGGQTGVAMMDCDWSTVR